MKEQINLKPCPFCGSTRVYVGDPLPGVEIPACLCLDCGGTIHHCYSDKAEAIAAWNRRSSDELKPCPFCGGEAEVLQDDNDKYYVSCRKCYTLVGYCVDTWAEYKTEAKAIDAWNRRSDHDTD